MSISIYEAGEAAARPLGLSWPGDRKEILGYLDRYWSLLSTKGMIQEERRCVGVQPLDPPCGRCDKLCRCKPRQWYFFLPDHWGALRSASISGEDIPVRGLRYDGPHAPGIIPLAGRFPLPGWFKGRVTIYSTGVGTVHINGDSYALSPEAVIETACFEDGIKDIHFGPGRTGDVTISINGRDITFAEGEPTGFRAYEVIGHPNCDFIDLVINPTRKRFYNDTDILDFDDPIALDFAMTFLRYAQSKDSEDANLSQRSYSQLSLRLRDLDRQRIGGEKNDGPKVPWLKPKTRPHRPATGSYPSKSCFLSSMSLGCCEPPTTSNRTLNSPFGPRRTIGSR